MVLNGLCCCSRCKRSVTLYLWIDKGQAGWEGEGEFVEQCANNLQLILFLLSLCFFKAGCSKNNPVFGRGRHLSSSTR